MMTCSIRIVVIIRCHSVNSTNIMCSSDDSRSSEHMISFEGRYSKVSFGRNSCCSVYMHVRKPK